MASDTLTMDPSITDGVKVKYLGLCHEIQEGKVVELQAHHYLVESKTNSGKIAFVPYGAECLILANGDEVELVAQSVYDSFRERTSAYEQGCEDAYFSVGDRVFISLSSSRRGMFIVNASDFHLELSTLEGLEIFKACRGDCEIARDTNLLGLQRQLEGRHSRIRNSVAIAEPLTYWVKGFGKSWELL